MIEEARFSRLPGLRLACAGTVALVLNGCPLSDGYFVDPSYGVGLPSGGSASTAGATAGGLGVGGSAVALAGGSTGMTGGGASSTVGGTPGEAGMASAEAGAAGSDIGAGNSAGTGASCTADTCSSTCCGSACVELANDAAHCGDCEIACIPGQACSEGKCVGGWVSMAAPPSEFVARQKAAFTSFDGKLFIFGGQDSNADPLGDAAIYDPATDTWTLVAATAHAPSPRRLATAVWTGSRILVVGGRTASSGVGLLDGAAYDPATGEWSPIGDELRGRVGAIGGASSSHAVLWQGWGAMGTSQVSGAERYTSDTDSWEAAPETSAPGALQDPAWSFTGTSLYVFGGALGGSGFGFGGGSGSASQGWVYTLSSNAWTTLAGGAGAPMARTGGFGAWDGESFYVWGGRDMSGTRADGSLYSGGAWTALKATGAPSARSAAHREAGWAFALGAGDVVFLGGVGASGTTVTDGGRLRGSSWEAIGDWPSAEEHAWGVAAQAGGAILLWGGSDGGKLTATGERWAP